MHLYSTHLPPPKGGINPDVAIEAFTMNITTVDGFDAFKASVTRPGQPDVSRVDLILSCVDNYEARITINQVGARGGGCCLRVARTALGVGGAQPGAAASMGAAQVPNTWLCD